MRHFNRGMTPPRTANDARVLTLHPDADKQGVRIAAAKYDATRKALLRVIPARAPGVAFADLPDLVRPLLPIAVFGRDPAVRWYVTTVKLDLEARGLVQRVPGRGPQRLVRKS